MRKIWELWKKFAKKIGDFQATVIFSILYYLIFTPLGTLLSIKNDYLGKNGFSGWDDYLDNSSTITKMKRQN